MKATTLRLSEETLNALETEAEEQGVSRSEYIRAIIEHRDEYGEHTDEYEDRIKDLERENRRLRNEKRALIKDREKRKELVRYVEDELSYRQAGLGRRMKWWFFGKD